MKFFLTHLNLACFLLDMGKQHIPVLAYRMFYQNLNKNKHYHLTALKTDMYWSKG